MTKLVLRPHGMYAQAQQEAILTRIFAAIGPTNKRCVEFGFNSTTLVGGSGSNAARLVLQEGWTGLFFDQSFQNLAINLHREHLTPENIGSVFHRYEVPTEPDYVSIDVDSIDLWLFRALLLDGFRPHVISVEYNSNYGIEACVTVKPGTTNANDQCYGASLTALYRVGITFGYVLVDVEPGLDLFFVRGDRWTGPVLTPELCQAFTKLSVHPVPKPGRAAKVMMEYRA